MAYTQAEYRARNDDGGEAAATWKAVADAPWDQAIGKPFRVRCRITTSAVADGLFAWEYSTDNTTWVAMPAAGTAGVPVRFADSANLTDAEATTQQLGAGTFKANRVHESDHALGDGILSTQETEVEGCFELVSGQVNKNDQLYFRVVEVTDMVLQLNTASQADKTVRVPLQGTMNVDIDWGDGNTDTGVTTADPEHTYAAHGTYTVQVSGSAETLGNATPHTRWKDTLVACHSFGSLGLTSLDSAFREFSGTSLVLPSVLPVTVTNLGNLCRETSLVSPPTGMVSWATGNVTVMGLMWYNSASLTALPDMTGWDTSSNGNLYFFARGCTSIAVAPDVSTWDTGLTANMRSAWQSVPVSVDCSAWDVTSLTDATSMYLSSGLSTAHYDALLIAWSAQTVQSGVAFHAGTAKYTPGGAAEAGRDTLTGSPNLWTITDGGPVT